MEFHSCDRWNLLLLLCFCLLMADNLASAEIGECSSFDGSEKGTRFLKLPLNCTGCPTAIEQIDLKENMFKINDAFIVFHGVRRITLLSSPHLQVRNYSSNYWSVTVKREFDREDPEFDYQDFYTESISCTPLNDGSPIYYSVRLHILNVIEEGPKFSKRRYDMNVSEDTTKDAFLMTIQPVFNETTDVNLDFSLTPIGGNDNLVLDLQKAPSRSADITLLKKLDYDKGVTSYNMTLTAKVNGMSNLTATTEIVVHVTDVDDQNPTFTQEVYSCSVPEGVVIHTSVMCDTAPNAYDQDKGLNEKLNYQIVGIVDHISMPFVINADTGKITVNGTIDREKKDSYAFTIMAKQNDKPSLRQATSLVYIHVTDVNDNAPVMSSKTYNASIMENLPEGTFVLKVEATDLDKGNNSLFAFQLSGNYAPFEIDGRSGVIIVKNSTLLDRETVSSFMFQVQAFETATKENRTSQKSFVIVTLQDQNDNSPEFNVSNKQVIYVNKTTPVDTIIGQVTAFDKDTGDNGKVTFSLYGSNDTVQKFKIDRHTGYIKVAESLTNKHFISFRKSAIDITQELEKTFIRSYRFDIKASDSNRKERRQSAIAMVINVLDENVNPPFVVWPPTKRTLKISEKFPIKVTFLRVEALDLDPDDIPSLSITVDPQPFAISKNIIYLTKHLDRENQSRYDLNVTVFDGKHTNVTTCTVEVQDENDNAPRFSMEMYNFSLTEETKNEMVGQVNATDFDDGMNAKFDYSFIPSLWSSNFSIYANGTIITKTKIDRELLKDSGAVIHLNVIAVDHGNPKLTGTTVVKLEVTDLNDNTPVFLDIAETIYVVDELALKRNFCQVKAFDPDYDDIVFSLTKNPHKAFNIDSNGFISVVLPIELGITKSSTLILTVQASNKMPYTNTKLNSPERNITVFVKDVNNRGPVFSKRIYSFVVEEGITGTLSRECINAKDKDEDVLNRIITYKIISGDVDDHLYIDSHTGCLQIVRAFDYEKQRKYSVEIEASDALPWYNNETAIHNVTTTVYINIQDVNDSTPTCDQVETTTTLPPVPQRSDISCNADTIDTFVPISMLPSGAPLTWRDPSCKVTSNGTHMISSIGHNQCGTTVTITKDTVEFENELTAQISNHSSNTLIDFGENSYVIPVKCIYPRTETPMTSYVPLQQHVRFYEKRYGHFDVDITQYDSDKFSSAIQGLGVPRKVALNAEIFVEVKMNDQFNNGLGIHVDKCIATPSPSPSDSTYYNLLTDGCPASQHVQLYNAPANKVRFGVRAFQFTSHNSSIVYIHCQTSMCEVGTPYCVSNCVTAGRRKRDVAPDQKSHLVSTGPFVFMADEQDNPIRMSTIVASVSLFVAVVACVAAVMGWTRKKTHKCTKEEGLL